MVNTKRPRTQSLTVIPGPPKRSKLPQNDLAVARPPTRRHSFDYHRAALLDDEGTQAALLCWYDKASKTRNMPWRQDWIDPASFERKKGAHLELRDALKQRAYQVWISEIMLQQTRVETVKAYYESWHSRWPTIEDLANASPTDVLNAWRGLGYYSRATRIHTAAKKVTSDPIMNGLLPELPAELESKVPGVGRYTAGAISSIVFGHAVPVLDGNVSRVLCRQLGLYANIKSKRTSDLLWETAEQLVEKATTNVLVKRGIEVDETMVPKSDTPSFWNQALMEIGSTLCKPSKPECSGCPIQKTCKAHAEGAWLAVQGPSSVQDRTSSSTTVDIEDICDVCEQMDLGSIASPDSVNSVSTEIETDLVHKSTQRHKKQSLKQSTLSFSPRDSLNATADISANEKGKSNPGVDQLAEQYASLFPMRVAKKAAREEECVVCVIRRIDQGEAKWMIEQRPSKGLLANLWQFPSHTIASDETAVDNLGMDNITDDDSTPLPKSKNRVGSTRRKHSGGRQSSDGSLSAAMLAPAGRKSIAVRFVHSVLQSTDTTTESFGSTSQSWKINPIKDCGSITHLFSHIKLVMHVYYFDVRPLDTPESGQFKWTEKSMDYQQRKWGSHSDVEKANFGTGMRRCWALVNAR